MYVDELLQELDLMIRDVELLGADELTDVLDEVIPELEDLCKNVWLLELVIEHCKGRGK